MGSLGFRLPKLLVAGQWLTTGERRNRWTSTTTVHGTGQIQTSSPAFSSFTQAAHLLAHATYGPCCRNPA